MPKGAHEASGRPAGHDRYRRVLGALLAVGLVVCVAIGAVRAHKESQSRRVEIALDYTDFAALARAYGYNPEQFLIALRRAGLTSLAIPEELGSSIDSGRSAILVTGQSLIDQARLGSVSDPTLAALARGGGLQADELYLVIFDPAAVSRYQIAIRQHFGPGAARVLRAAGPTILAIHSQIDYFNALGFGFPADAVAVARRTGLLLEPRLQNDDHYTPADIDRLLGQFQGHVRASTVIFFGSRNEVLGYPEHLADTAAALQKYGLNFGFIEVYEKNQIQKGSEGLARLIIGRTTRVQAISKAEQDKLKFPAVVARYLLGVNERNVRVVYLRPWAHPEGTLTVEGANIELVRQIADGLHARGFTLGRATPVPDFAIPWPVLALALLAVPAGFLLLIDLCGWNLRRFAWVAFAVTYLLVLAGALVGHELLARKLLALVGAIEFATLAVVVLAPAFAGPAPKSLGPTLLAGLRTVALAGGVALGGAAVVVGLLSVPLLMEEIERFTGVKAVILLPPLLALGLYLYTGAFGTAPLGLWSSLREPIRVYQFGVGLLLLIAGVLYISRSGNASEIAPSAFELSLRHGLTALLGVRPRTKEFLVGFPLMMLLPALPLVYRRAVGWLFALGIAIGTADIIDTFSHLHTPLLVSLIRLLNGAVLGCVIGAIAVLILRAVVARRPRAAEAPSAR